MSVSGALAFPLAAGAVDHIVLHISPTKLARSGPLKAWSLDGTIVDASFYPMTPPEELFGVTLRRRFLNGRAAEEHAFRAAPAHTLTFDGNTGLWEARLGNMLTVRMAIETTREPQAVPDAQACRGAFMRVPVLLRGTFTLPTRTKVFKTVRRTRLAATVTYNSGGPVSCGAGDTQTCTASTSFSASAGVGAQLLASADLGGWLSLAFADTRSSGVDGAIWYHVMLLTQFNPLGGVLPGLTLRVPAKLPIQGSGVFSATETSTAQRGACHTTTARGTFDGVFRTRFVGWGGRTFRSPASAMYSESR
jgi:hypothetical protein